MKQLHYLFLTFISGIIICLGFTPYIATAANDAEMEMNQTEIMHRGRLPEGLIMRHGKIMLKRGYFYRQVSGSQVNIISPLKGNITGNIQCRCKYRGHCRIVANPQNVYCSRRQCHGGRCSLRINTPQVTIMGGEHINDDHGQSGEQPQ